MWSSIHGIKYAPFECPIFAAFASILNYSFNVPGHKRMKTLINLLINVKICGAFCDIMCRSAIVNEPIYFLYMMFSKQTKGSKMWIRENVGII